MSIDQNGTIRRASPSFARVREWMIRYIADQKLSAGARIPSDRALAGTLGLSRPTVARAISALADEGLLVREERSGTFVGSQIVRPVVTDDRYTIGIVTPWISQDELGRITGFRNTGWQPGAPIGGDMMSLQLIHGVVSVLNPHGHRLQIHSIRWPDDEITALELLRSRLVDGAIVVPMAHGGQAGPYADIAANGPPIVFVDHHLPGLNVDCVSTDNFNATRESVLQLIKNGHRRIAYFTDFGEMTSVLDREAGYRKALEESGIPFDDEIVCGSQNLRGGGKDFFFSLEHCKNLSDPVTAVFCMNDDIVWAAIQAANRLGLSIPGQLEIAGFFDDHIPEGINVPFTRLVQSTFDMGRIASEMLLERIDGTAPPEARHVSLPVQVVLGTAG